MTERRRSTRRRCLLSCRLEFNNRNSTMDCIMRDKSDGGARLVLDYSQTVPAEFHFISSDHGQRRRARIAWRDETRVGIELLAG